MSIYSLNMLITISNTEERKKSIHLYLSTVLQIFQKSADKSDFYSKEKEMGNFNLRLQTFSHKKLHGEVILLDYLKWDILSRSSIITPFNTKQRLPFQLCYLSTKTQAKITLLSAVPFFLSNVISWISPKPGTLPASTYSDLQS